MLNRTIVVCVVAAAGAAVLADIVEQGVTEAGQSVDVLAETDDLLSAELVEQFMDGAAGFEVDLHEHASLFPMVLSVTDLAGVHDFTPMRARASMSIEGIFAAAGLRPSETAAGKPAAAAFRFSALEAISEYDSLGGRTGLGIGEEWFDAAGSGQAPLAGTTLAHLDNIFRASDAGGRLGGMNIALGGGAAQDMPTAVMADRAIPAPGSAAVFGMGVLMAFGRRRR